MANRRLRQALISTLLALVAVLPFAGWVGLQSANADTKLTEYYDTDGDGLMEIVFIEQLAAVRYDLNGDGVADTPEYADAYAAAFPIAGPGVGCANGCSGYELTRSLNFKNPKHYATGKVDWNLIGGKGLAPIGDKDNGFSATFDGNGHTITNLFIKLRNQQGGSYVGLFGKTLDSGVIRGVGLNTIFVSGDANVGGLVGWNLGEISDSYTGGEVSGEELIGGLVGRNEGSIVRSQSSA